jgi:hypothetical protein
LELALANLERSENPQAGDWLERRGRVVQLLERLERQEQALDQLAFTCLCEDLGGGD